MVRLSFLSLSLLCWRCTLQVRHRLVAAIGLAAISVAQDVNERREFDLAGGREEFIVVPTSSSWLKRSQHSSTWAKRLLSRAYELYQSPGLTEDERVWVYQDAWRHLVASYEVDPFLPGYAEIDLFSELLRGYSNRILNQLDILLDRVHRHYQRFSGSKKKKRVLEQQLDQLKQAMGVKAWIDYWARYDASPSSLPRSLLTGEEQELAQAQKLTSPAMNVLLSRPHVFLPFSDLVVYWDGMQAPSSVTDDDLDSLIRAAEKGFALAEKQDVQRKDGANGNFYAWQQTQRRTQEKDFGYWDGFDMVPAFHKMKSVIRKGLVEYLEKLGMSKEEAIVSSKRALMIWATVMADDATHIKHDHGDAVVSGVFYVRALPGQQRIVFSDPRTSVPRGVIDPPPFHRGFGIEPTQRSMVMFPGYLQHSVERSEGSKRSKHNKNRISFAFNLQGEWEDSGSLAFHRDPTTVQTVHMKHNVSAQVGSSLQSSEQFDAGRSLLCLLLGLMVGVLVGRKTSSFSVPATLSTGKKTK